MTIGLRQVVGDRDRSTEEFARLVAGQQDRLLRLAYLLTSDRGGAEDAVAEAVSRVYARWRRGGIDNPGAYLRTAVVHEVRGRARRAGLERRERSRRWGDRRGQLGVADRVVDRHEVLTALEHLAPRQRMVVVLRFFEDLSVAQTAAVLSISEGTVKSQLSRALDHLREHFLDRAEERR